MNDDLLNPHSALVYMMVLVSAADQRIAQEELNLLQQLCYNLGLDRLTAVAIERGIRARHISL